MRYWDGIIACGLTGYSITSMADLLSTLPPMIQVRQAIISAFEDVFNVKCLEVT
jgi:lipoate-protein ligase B